jgi:hypothetical protein
MDHCTLNRQVMELRIGNECVISPKSLPQLGLPDKI